MEIDILLITNVSLLNKLSLSEADYHTSLELLINVYTNRPVSTPVL